MYTVGHSRLISTGIYLPEERVTSRELMQAIHAKGRFGVSDDWLERVTGIREKRVTAPGMLPSDMAVRAAWESLERASLGPDMLDAIIYTGATRDHSVEPATAHIVQSKLHAYNAVAFDVSNACHGFMNGIHLLDALIATGQVRRGLVVTGEQGSLFAERAVTALSTTHDRSMLAKLAAGLTLGDAGAAVLMGPKTNPDTGFMGFMLRSQGQYASCCTAGGILTDGPVVTDMPAIVAESTRMHAAMFNEFLGQRLKWRVEDLSRYVIHQVGTKIFKLHSDIGGIPLEIIPKTVDTMGNLITANIPMVLHLLSINQEVKAGNRVFLSGAGSGISISQAGLIWEAA